jgi:hypothetical protein
MISAGDPRQGFPGLHPVFDEIDQGRIQAKYPIDI